MAITISIVVLLILVAVLLHFRRGKTGSRDKARPKSPVKADTGTAYHAVSISFGAGACDAAIALDGKRFLSSEAPRLPLADCDATECKCTFRHYADRRHKEDRRNPYRSSIAGESGVYSVDQRKLEERRDEPPDDIFED